MPTYIGKYKGIQDKARKNESQMEVKSFMKSFTIDKQKDLELGD